MLDYTLTKEDLAFWKENHYLVLRNPMNGQQVDTLKGWANDLIEWPERAGKWMKYFE